MNLNTNDLSSYSNEELAQLCNNLKQGGDGKDNLILLGAVFREGERRLGDDFLLLLGQQ